MQINRKVMIANFFIVHGDCLCDNAEQLQWHFRREALSLRRRFNIGLPSLRQSVNCRLE